MRCCYILFLLLGGVSTIFAQVTTGQRHTLSIKKKGDVSPASIEEDWAPVLQSREMPVPGGEWEEMIRIKKRVTERFPRSSSKHHNFRHKKQGQQEEAERPYIGKNFEGNIFDGGLPNDNNIAISARKYLVSVINSNILAYDRQNDSSLFTVSLSAFADTLGLSGNKYDPKVLYDPLQQRFILVFLNGTASNNSKIVVAFSSNKDPTRPWHLYTLSGSPLSDTTWSDYPAIAINEKEFFLTINLLEDGQNWENGFTRTLIWQVDKTDGYQGKDSLSTQLWSNIKYKGQFVRYLHPVQKGGLPVGRHLYFLSNRNFAVQNDTIFIAHLSDTIGAKEASMTIKHARTDITYGMPPNGQQANNQELATNDARMLGAFQKGKQVQYVHNSVDTMTGTAAVYHGLIADITNTSPSVSGHIISDTVLDYGYPNIAYTGRKGCEDESIITFNHTALSEPAGCSGVYFSNQHTYSNEFYLKKGGGYIDHLLFSSVERWGDYSGIQRNYEKPGHVWMAGMWGDSSNNQSTWLAQLTTPDTVALLVAQLSDSSDQSLYGQCDGSLQVHVKGGHPPYSYQWNDPDSQQTPTAKHLCKGTYTVTVTDAVGCTYTARGQIQEPAPQTNLFPNPTRERAQVYFTLNKPTVVTVKIYARDGRLVKKLLKEQAKKGRNVFSFSLQPLADGIYLVKVEGRNTTLMTKKIVKQ